MDEPKPQVMLEPVEATMASPMFRAEAAADSVPRVEVPASADVPESAEVLASAEVPESAESTESAESPESAEPPELPAVAISRRLGLEIAILAAVGVAASFLAADARAAVVVGSFALAVVGIRLIDRHVTFSFGAGFIGYRGDLGWPRGVQEDDDVQWNWKRRAPDARDGPA